VWFYVASKRMEESDAAYVSGTPRSPEIV
jgi:hypothetical protein